MRAILAPLLLVTLVQAAAPPQSRVEPWSVDDIVLQRSASEFHFAPDGSSLVFVKAGPDTKKNELVRHLFRLRNGRVVQLTRGSESCSSPRWSPDGVYLAFLSSRPAPKAADDKGRSSRDKSEDDDAKAQIWLLDLDGGEPWPVTSHTRDVQAFGWIDRDTLVFAAQEEMTRRESTLKEKKDTTAVVEDDPFEPPVRLYKVDRSTKKITRLSDNRDRIESLQISPDGKFAVALHSQTLRYTYDNKTKPVVFLHDLTTGARRRVLADPRYNISALLWSPDSKGFYATNEHTSKPHLNQAGVTRLLYHDLAAGKEAELDLAWPRGLVTQDVSDYAPGVVPLRDGFLALLAEGVHSRLARYTRQNNKLVRSWIDGEHVRNLFGFAATPDGQHVVYAHSAASSPTRWYTARMKANRFVEPRALPTLNEHFAKRQIARSEIVRWKGAYGETVEGILFYPHNYQPGKRAPLVVQIHGGPAAADHDCWDESWSYSANLVAQRGAFVLRPNYHGSTGYGQKWLESICDGKYCEPELEDIEKGVDALIARGLVDAERLALTGWSNGAILTNAMITRTTRYKAAVAGAGTIEYISDWSSCEFGDAFDRFYLGKSPLEDRELYYRKSPFYRLDKVTTPTLILFGTEDRVVHPQQGWAQYRAMQQLGKTPVRFVQFPGEKHSLKKLSHQRRKAEEEMAWLDRHLFKKDVEEDHLVNKDSPLHWRLQRRKAARVGRLYGKQEGTLLIPEVVAYEGMQVGRFEVTRAQFAQFDKAYRYPAGTENYPASGITFEQAQAYCRWLSEKTARRYRLPTEKEAETLYDTPGEGDNTLDAWAGYKVNYDDAIAIRKKLGKLFPEEILREVGSGRGVGKNDLIYDLGGNVSEWILGKNNKKTLQGGSADTPGNAREMGLVPGKDFSGFRIMLD